MGTELAVVVSGPALAHVLEDDDLKLRFLSVGRQCKVQLDVV
jgi:hypothetical protein